MVGKGNREKGVVDMWVCGGGEEGVSDGELVELGEGYMEKMGYGNEG